jgi:hypothetical protein
MVSGIIESMQAGLDAMKVALRVLTALTERKDPTAEDLSDLRMFAPDANRLAPDELACEVIQRSIKARAMAREAGKSSGV